MLLRDMKISVRLVLGFGMMAVLILLLGITAQLKIGSVSDALGKLCKTSHIVWQASACHGILFVHEAIEP